MRKSSVYLPDDLKDSLAALAIRWDRSEADLIRLAIDRLVRSATDEPSPGRTVDVPAGPRLVGVGVGPSDPALLTERAIATLRAADRVIAASTGTDAIGRAEAVVRAAAPEVAVDRVVLEIGGDDEARRRSVSAAADTVLGHLDRGELVAFVVLGDPNVYSVFPALARRVRTLRPGVDVETVPGVMAFQELAARTGTVVADGDEAVTILTLSSAPSGGGAELAQLLDDGGGVIVYKGGRRLPELAAELGRRGRLEGAVVGEMLGLTGGRAGPVADAADRPASYLATVVVPPRRDPEADELGGPG